VVVQRGVSQDERKLPENSLPDDRGGAGGGGNRAYYFHFPSAVIARL